VLLNRLVKPVAEIERQLLHVATSPSVEGCELREVPSVGAAAMGWNRIVRQRVDVPQGESLQERVRRSLEQVRQSRVDAVLNSIPEGVATTDSDGALTYTNTPLAVLVGLKEPIGASNNPADGPAPRMVEQLRQRWTLDETDPILAGENRDRSVVTELTREENGQRRIIRVARHPIGPGGGQAGCPRLDASRCDAAKTGRRNARPVCRHGDA
jgi:PAS domain-containing protein